MFATLKRGSIEGLKTAWKLSKFIFPITFLVTLLQFTPVLPWLVDVIAPVMQIFGLPGEAAIPLVLGTMLNLYSGIAGILSLELTVKEVFTLAVMLSFAHSLFIETAVALRVGVKLWVVLAVRFGLAIFAALMVNWLWNGGQEIAQYGLMPEMATNPEGWGAILLLALSKASYGIFQLVLIVLPLMIVVQFLRDYGYMTRFSNKLGPFMKIIDVKPNASMTLVTGLVIGLAYGAGVMIQAVEEDGVSKRDATLVFIFLVACHAVVEDTLIFVPLGIPILPLLLIRVVTAFVLTILVAYLMRRADVIKEGKGVLQQ